MKKQRKGVHIDGVLYITLPVIFALLVLAPYQDIQEVYWWLFYIPLVY